jgi:hypothetical protein
MFSDIKFCVKYGDDKVTDSVEQGRNIRQCCCRSPYLFNIVIDHFIKYTAEGNVGLHAQIIGKMKIARLLFAGDLAV